MASRAFRPSGSRSEWPSCTDITFHSAGIAYLHARTLRQPPSSIQSHSGLRAHHNRDVGVESVLYDTFGQVCSPCFTPGLRP
jgi:hypothetical protein